MKLGLSDACFVELHLHVWVCEMHEHVLLQARLGMPTNALKMPQYTLHVGIKQAAQVDMRRLPYQAADGDDLCK